LRESAVCSFLVSRIAKGSCGKFAAAAYILRRRSGNVLQMSGALIPERMERNQSGGEAGTVTLAYAGINPMCSLGCSPARSGRSTPISSFD
jgi:hypothetical protein